MAKNPFMADTGTEDYGFTQEDIDDVVILDDIPEKPLKPSKAQAEDLEDEDDDNDTNENGDDDENDDDDAPKGRGQIDELLEEIRALKAERQNDIVSNQKAQAALALAHVASNIEAVDAQIASLKQAQQAAITQGNLGHYHAIQDRLNTIGVQRQGFIEQKTKFENFAKAPAPKAQNTNGMASDWAGRHKGWFNPNGGDEASDYVIKVSKDLDIDGFDPTKPAHFRELEKRIKRSKFAHVLDGTYGAYKAKKTAQVAGAATSAPGKKGGLALPKAVLKLAKDAGLDTTDKEVLKRLARGYKESSAALATRK